MNQLRAEIGDATINSRIDANSISVILHHTAHITAESIDRNGFHWLKILATTVGDTHVELVLFAGSRQQRDQLAEAMADLATKDSHE